METHTHTRRGPGAVLLVALAVGLLYVFLTGGDAAGAGVSMTTGSLRREMDTLEGAIGSGKADAGVWVRYAKCHRALHQYRYAAEALQMALKIEPVNRDCQFLRGLMLALASDSEAFYQYVFDLSLNDPPLVFDILNRQECKPYLSETRFQKLHQEALAQYLD